MRHHTAGALVTIHEWDSPYNKQVDNLPAPMSSAPDVRPVQRHEGDGEGLPGPSAADLDGPLSPSPDDYDSGALQRDYIYRHHISIDGVKSMPSEESLFGSDSDSETDYESEVEPPAGTGSVQDGQLQNGQVHSGQEGSGISGPSQIQVKPKLLPVHDAAGNVVAFQQYIPPASVAAPPPKLSSARKEFKHEGKGKRTESRSSQGTSGLGGPGASGQDLAQSQRTPGIPAQGPAGASTSSNQGSQPASQQSSEGPTPLQGLPRIMDDSGLGLSHTSQMDDEINSLRQLTQVSQQPQEARFQGTLGPNLQSPAVQHVMDIVAPARQKTSNLSEWEGEYFWNGLTGGVQGRQVTKDDQPLAAGSIKIDKVKYGFDNDSAFMAPIVPDYFRTGFDASLINLDKQDRIRQDEVGVSCAMISNAVKRGIRERDLLVAQEPRDERLIASNSQQLEVLARLSRVTFAQFNDMTWQRRENLLGRVHTPGLREVIRANHPPTISCLLGGDIASTITEWKNKQGIRVSPVTNHPANSSQGAMNGNGPSQGRGRQGGGGAPSRQHANQGNQSAQGNKKKRSRGGRKRKAQGNGAPNQPAAKKQKTDGSA